MFNGKHMPFWLDSAQRTNFSSLCDETIVDVAVVGGGIAGISTGFMLKKHGLNVAVIESNRIVSDVTAGTTAKITVTSSLIYNHILSNFGKEFALKFYNANCDAFDTIPKIINELDIDCDYRSSSLYIYASNEESFSIIDDEFAILNELGIPAKPIGDLPYPFNGVHGLQYENQAEFHPKKYLNGLANFIDGEGSFIFEKTRTLSVVDFSNDNSNSNNNLNHTDENGNGNKSNDDEYGLKKIITNNGIILAKFVVIATNSPIYDPDCVCDFMSTNKSYVMGVYPKKELPFGMFVDVNPFHSYRSTPTEKGEMFIVAGEHHQIGEVEDTWECFKRLNNHIEDIFDTSDIEYFWSNQDNRSEDGIPIIGETSHDNVFIATGFGSWGMTTGTLAANIISYMILKKLGKPESISKPINNFNTNNNNASNTNNINKNNIDDYFNIFNPQRFKGKKASKDIKKYMAAFDNEKAENSNNYNNSNDTNNEFNEEESKLLANYLMKLEHDEAKIVDIGDKSVAIYKDIDSNIYAVDSKSTHSGCKLAWNSAEKTWECPEFGSRFTYGGKVIHGPAVYDLKSFLS